MKIDRALFLLLTGTLSAAACNASAPPPIVGTTSPTASSSTPPPPSATTSPKPDATIDASSPTAPTASAPPVASSSPTDAGAPVATMTPDAGPALPPVDPSTLKPVGAESGCGRGKRTFDDTRTGCDDTTGAMPDCGTLQMGYASSEVCPGPIAARRRCNVATTNFKPLVANAVHACLQKTTGKYCNSCNMYQCNYNSLMGACPDPTADAACDTIARSCNGFDKARCRAYLSGMTKRGRDNMVSCLKTSCSKGFLMCLQALPESP